MLLWAAVLVVAVVAGGAGRAGAALLPLAAERLRADVGGHAVMNCRLDFPFGNEIPYHLQWDKDGETIFSWYSGEGGGAPRVADCWGGRVRLVGGVGGAGGAGGAGLGRGSINVTAVRDTDAGLYRCRVAFPNRSPPERNNGTFYYLDVDGGNLVARPPVNVTVVEGERAELECAPRGPGAEVEWLRDGAPLTALPELAARAERPANGSLVLRHALSHDAGEYTCRVRAPHEPEQTASAFLDVQYKAKVVYAPKERYLPYGKPASLDCHFSANPPLTNLRWEKDGFLFDPYNVPGVFYSRNGSLLFNRVDESHEGQYSCTAYNVLGTEGPSPGVRVRVQRPPALAARPRPLYLTRLGGELTLPCTAALDPHHAAPAVHWTKKDGSPLPEGRYSLSGGNLTLSGVSEQDRGVYVCTATNEAAAVSAETELLIENVPPRAPYNLTAAPAPGPPAAVHVTWVPGHNDVDTEYVVWYRERAASEWRTMKILSRGVTQGALRGLRPGAEYEVRVLAQDRLGDGLFSKPVFVRTPDVEMEEDGETAYAAAITEGGPVSVADVDEEPGWGELDGEGRGEGAGEDDEAGGALRVSVRLLDEGALVRWQRAPGAAGRCELRWSAPLEGGAPGAERLLHAATTDRDYILVSPVEEGVRYMARVRCGGAGGAAGAGALQVPRWGRLRAAALGSAAAALLLAALATAVYFMRHRLFPHNNNKSRSDKRRY